MSFSGERSCNKVRVGCIACQVLLWGIFCSLSGKNTCKMLWPHSEECSISSHTGSATFVLKVEMHLKAFLGQRQCWTVYDLILKAKCHVFTSRNPNKPKTSQSKLWPIDNAIE